MQSKLSFLRKGIYPEVVYKRLVLVMTKKNQKNIQKTHSSSDSKITIVFFLTSPQKLTSQVQGTKPKCQVIYTRVPVSTNIFFFIANGIFPSKISHLVNQLQDCLIFNYVRGLLAMWHSSYLYKNQACQLSGENIYFRVQHNSFNKTQFYNELGKKKLAFAHSSIGISQVLGQIVPCVLFSGILRNILYHFSFINPFSSFCLNE